MNLRHAAALALMGWFLMIPDNILGVPNPSAHLPAWQIWQIYDSAAECQKSLSVMKAASEYQLRLKMSKRPNSYDRSTHTFWQDTQDGRCIAGDDPRLKR
jgi:hypothetical protein